MSRRKPDDEATRTMRGDKHRHIGFHAQPIIPDPMRPVGIVYSPTLRRRRSPPLPIETNEARLDGR